MPSVKNCSQFSAAHLRPSKIVGKTVENHALSKIVPYSPGFPHQATENTWAARNRKFLYSRPPDPLTRPRPLTSTFHFVPPSADATPPPPLCTTTKIQRASPPQPPLGFSATITWPPPRRSRAPPRVAPGCRHGPARRPPRPRMPPDATA
jgi:hypothetical protein